jgi:hypothetical protein
MSWASKPLLSVGTMKPRTSPSTPPTFAQTMARLAMLPLVIQRLVPLRTQLSPSSIAVVRMPAGFDP